MAASAPGRYRAHRMQKWRRGHRSWLLALSSILLCHGCSADPQTSTADADDRGVALPPAPDARLEIAISDVPVVAIDAAPDTARADADSAPDTDGLGPDLPADLAPPDDDGAMPDVPPADVPKQPLAARRCVHRFSFAPEPGLVPTSVTVPGAFNAWDTAATPLADDGTGVWTGELDMSGLTPGSYAYKILVGADDWRFDAANKMRLFDGPEGVVNSKLRVPDCTLPALDVVKRVVDPLAGTASLEVQPLAGVGGTLDPATLTVTHNGLPVTDAWNAAAGLLRIDVSGLAQGKHTWRFDAGPAGAQAEPVVISFWVEPEAFDWRDAVLYFAFVDRFRDADPTVGQPSPCLDSGAPGNWRGGDWKGVTAAIEGGYFDTIGVNAIWLNAPQDNPDSCMLGLGGYTYTAYHGYFPAQPFEAEGQFGTIQDLRELVAAAHARGIRVLVDLVANHVHDTAPEWLEHGDDGWFNLPQASCAPAWDAPETCWFESYLPDLDHRQDAVVEHVVNVALWWAREVDLDGFRVDAVKHVHPHFLNTLRSRLDAQLEATSDSLFWTVGETFTGGWGGGTGTEEALIKEYIGEDRLYGQFDFPLYWALLGSFAHRDAGLDTLADVLTGSLAYYGPAAIMGSFLGNHDVPRFVSRVNGDVWDDSILQAWTSPPGQPGSDMPYQRLEEAFTFMAAIPWVPLIYYGDEVGLAGTGDPDNRRMLPADAALSARQLAVRQHVGAVMNARGANRALRRGTLAVPQASSDLLVITRSAGPSFAAAVFNQGGSAVDVTVSAPAGATLTPVNAASVIVAGSGGSTLVTVPANSAALLVTPD